MGDTEQRLPDRLARRERNVPIPEPDNVDALAATLADWGAEHRSHHPCSACGCTLFWTAAGADMCAICLPMPRLTDTNRERIARMFPQTPHGPHGADAWSKRPKFWKIQRSSPFGGGVFLALRTARRTSCPP